MTIIAKGCKGAEFFYRANTAHKVPKTSANKICEALNKARYNLGDNEIWHVYEVGGYENAAIFAEGQRFAIRKGRLVEVRG